MPNLRRPWHSFSVTRPGGRGTVPIRALGAITTSVAVLDLVIYVPDRLANQWVGGVEPIWLGATVLAATVLLLVHHKSGRDAQVLTPVTVCCGLTFALALTWALAPDALPNGPLARADAPELGVGLIPLGFAYAIARHRLYGLEFFVRRTFVNLGIAAITATVFFTLLGVARTLQLNWRSSVVVAIGITSLAIPLIWHRSRDWLEAHVDQTLLAPYDTTGVELIAETLVERAAAFLPLAWQVVLSGSLQTRRAGEWHVITALGDAPPAIASLSSTLTLLSDPNIAVIPLEHSGARLGLWLLGPMRNGQPLDNTQRRLLEHLAHQIAGPLAMALRRSWAAAKEPVAVDPPALTLIAPLSIRESQVAMLVLQGRTNQQIAGDLVIHAGTVAKHIENIMRKLEFRSRAQIAGWAADRGLGQPASRNPPNRPNT